MNPAAPGAGAASPLIAVPAMAIASTDAGNIAAPDQAGQMPAQREATPAAAASAPAGNAPTQARATGSDAAPAAGTPASAPAQVEKQFTVPGRPASTATASHLGTPIGAPAASPGGAGSIGGAVLALVLVVGLILVLGWLAKRMPGIGGASNPALKVIGSLSLSPRERVVVVAVGDTQLVLGTGAGGTRVLHQLDTPLPVTPAKAPPAFAQVLAQRLGRKP